MLWLVSGNMRPPGGLSNGGPANDAKGPSGFGRCPLGFLCKWQTGEHVGNRIHLNTLESDYENILKEAENLALNPRRQEQITAQQVDERNVIGSYKKQAFK